MGERPVPLLAGDVENERRVFDEVLDRIESGWHGESKEQKQIVALLVAVQGLLHMAHNLTARIEALETAAPPAVAPPSSGRGEGG